MHIFVVHAIKRASKEESLQHHFIITGRRFTANNHRQKHRKYSKKCISSASAASRLPSTETVFYDQFFSFYFKRINLAQCLKNIFFFYWDAYMFFMIHRWWAHMLRQYATYWAQRWRIGRGWWEERRRRHSLFGATKTFALQEGIKK